MKKPWLLILAAIILITLIGLWLYLFFGGDEAKEDLYNTFGLVGDELQFDLGDVFDDQATSTSPYLRQLSLRQTIGYVALDASSSTPRTVRFVEAGTGHVYSVNVEDGTEERLSNITVPSAETAVLSRDGAYAAISVGSELVTVITLPSGSTTLSSRVLNINPISTSFTSDDTLLYAVKEGRSVRGYSYNLKTTDTTNIFIVPFREAVVLWGDTVAGTHYTYPKTAADLEGYLYEIKSDTLARLPVSGFGLSAIANDTSIIYSITENGVYKSYTYNKASSETAPVNFLFIPEKCLVVDSGISCATDVASIYSGSVESWYRGETIFSDALWYTKPDTKFTTQIEPLSETAGRSLDATLLTTKSQVLYFVNHNDSSLWVYDRDFTVALPDN
ncbi:MAG: hypothetical protein AAB618_00530 [Patescibacteria group bacterium]